MTDKPTSPRAERDYRGQAVVRIPAFRRMWGAIGISSFGDWLGLLAMMGLAQQLTQSGSIEGQAAAISGVLIVRLLPDLLLAPIAGTIADKFDRRKTVIVGEVLAGLMYLMIALTFDIRTMYVGQFVIEAIGLITMASKNTLWMSTVPKEKIAPGQQLLMFTIYGSFPLAAGLYALLSWFHRFFIDPAAANDPSAQKFVVLTALFIDAGTYFASALVIWWSRKMLPAHASGGTQRAESVIKLVGEGIKFVFATPTVRALYVGVIGAFAAAGITGGVAITYVNSLNAGFAGSGVLLGTAFTGLALGMLVGPRILPTVSRKRVFGVSIALAGGFLVGMGLSRDFGLGVGFSIGVGFFAGIAWILGYTMIGQEVEEHIRGRTFAFVVSSARIMLMITLAIGPVLSGVLGAHSIALGGINIVFSGPGLTLLIAGLFALLIGVYAGRSIGTQRLALRRVFDQFAARSEALGEPKHLGAFIVIEGADRALAERQAQLLADHLIAAGQPVVLTSEPSDTRVGRRIADLMDSVAAAESTDEPGLFPSTAVFLSAADRAERVDKLIRPALDEGKIVISSGYVDTTIAFFGAHRAVDHAEIIRLSEWGNEGLEADLTIVMDSDYPEGTPIRAVRDAFIARREAAMVGYQVIAPSTSDGLSDEVVRHATHMLDARSDFITNRV